MVNEHMARGDEPVEDLRGRGEDVVSNFQAVYEIFPNPDQEQNKDRGKGVLAE